MDDESPAQRNDWGNLSPMPSRHVSLPIDKVYSEKEMASIRHGFIPRGMEDKRFIFFEEDTLCLHRSWTGICIYQATFKTEGEISRVTGLLANRDPDQYRGTDNAGDARLFLDLVDHLLLFQF